MKIIVLTTPTCSKCKAMLPVLEEVCNDKGIELSIKNALDQSVRPLIDTYKIRQVPFVMIYDDNGELLKTHRDSMGKLEILDFINSVE